MSDHTTSLRGNEPDLDATEEDEFLAFLRGVINGEPFVEEYLALVGRVRDLTSERDEAVEHWNDYAERLAGEIEGREAAEARVAQLETALAGCAHTADHLHAMIPAEAWRDAGGDDGQGHYEGDYHAEQTLTNIREWARLAVSAGQGDTP